MGDFPLSPTNCETHMEGVNSSAYLIPQVMLSIWGGGGVEKMCKSSPLERLLKEKLHIGQSALGRRHF